MKVYTYSEARQRLSRLLDEAKSRGESRIMRQDGTEFTIQPVKSTGSPFDVKGVKTNVSMSDIKSAIREGRERNY
jgi:antitoxin Phd